MTVWQCEGGRSSSREGGKNVTKWLPRLVLTIAAVQIKDLLANCAKSGEEECKKYEDLRDVWLLGSAHVGGAAVGEEVRLPTKWLLRLMLTVAAVQIVQLRDAATTGEEEKVK